MKPIYAISYVSVHLEWGSPPTKDSRTCQNCNMTLTTIKSLTTISLVTPDALHHRGFSNFLISPRFSGPSIIPISCQGFLMQETVILGLVLYTIRVTIASCIVGCLRNRDYHNPSACDPRYPAAYCALRHGSHGTASWAWLLRPLCHKMEKNLGLLSYTTWRKG